MTRRVGQVRRIYRRMLAQSAVIAALTTATAYFLLQELPQRASRETAIMHINDVYRIEGVADGSGGLARVRALRDYLQKSFPDLLLLHAGDLLYPSLLSAEYNGQQMIDVLNALDGELSSAMDEKMFVAFGNHEFDIGSCKGLDIINSRVAESRFHWISSNITFVECGTVKPTVSAVLPHMIIESGGIRIGIISITTDKKLPDYAQIGSPILTALTATQALRRAGAEVVIALTHLPLSEDEEIIKALGENGPDLIVGGDDHENMQIQKNGRWIVKADADALTAGFVRISIDGSGNLAIVPSLIPLRPGVVEEDQYVADLADKWMNKHEKEFCETKKKPANCLSEKIGMVEKGWDGDETLIRRRQTSLGSWLGEVALEEFKACNVDVAFFNSGSLRLNQNIPLKGTITKRQIEELFMYPSDLALIQLTKEELGQIAKHSTEQWPGSGRWLQTAGFKINFSESSKAYGGIEMGDKDSIIAVTFKYLLTGPEDGYNEFKLADKSVKCSDVVIKDLKTVAEEALKKQKQ